MKSFKQFLKENPPAWHGSPHDHDGFSIDKIGTGEGATAYGWGLYFASNRKVAEWYRDELGDYGNVKYFYAGIPIQRNIQRVAASMLDYCHGDKIAATQRAHDRTSLDARELETVLKYIETMDYSQIKVTGLPRLYHVDILPSEDEMLDWDTPMSGQSGKVKAALENLPNQFSGDRKGRLEAYFKNENNYPYLVLTQEFSHAKNPKKSASEALAKAGIRGIKYLEGMSRQQGTGNLNYVVFRDKDVVIKEKF